MREKLRSEREPAPQVIKNIRRAPRRHFSAEDKIRIMLNGLRGEGSIAELCRREGIVQKRARRACGRSACPSNRCRQMRRMLTPERTVSTSEVRISIDIVQHIGI
jgi:transposase-like protein